ncbi:MAG: hypothetical protein A2535_14555 [Burkholderiales bacterium RIFOXYD2_FULL_59_8]|nr:MAG: hypothetical protein A2535_14555 [Burkholderiales bacterium RIFOXYD2_FULL_59_8]
MAEKLLTIREVAYALSLSEKEVIDLSEEGKIPAYKVGGLYLRFQKDQIDQYKVKIDTVTHRVSIKPQFTFSERLKDFFYFYDFYLLSGILIAILLAIIIRG